MGDLGSEGTGEGTRAVETGEEETSGIGRLSLNV